MSHKRVIAMFFLVLPLSLFGGLEQIRNEIVRYRLNNGLTLLILPKGDVPVFSAVTYAKVGSGDEEKDFWGMAHILEHMAFRGTETIGSGDIEREKTFITKEDSIFGLILEERRKVSPCSLTIEVLEESFNSVRDSSKQFGASEVFSEIVAREGGTRLNAGTSCDQTIYYSQFPSNKLELYMSLESDRFLSPVLREFYTETQGPIAEERRMGSEDSPVGRLFEGFLLTAFPPEYPYGHPIIGFTDDIMTATREGAEEFFQKHYIPQNLVVTIVGDVKPEEVIKLARIYFGRLPKRDAPPPLDVPEIPEGEKKMEIPMMAQPMLLLGYHRPDIKDPDDIIYDVIADYLGRGRTSLLYKSLVKERKIAVNVYCSPSFPGERYPSLFLFMAIPSAGHTAKECESAMYEEIKKLKKHLISEEELTKIKARTEADIIRAFEKNLHTARHLAWYEGIYGDYHYLFTYLDRLADVTPFDVQRVAKETFVKENRVVGSIIKKEGK